MSDLSPRARAADSSSSSACSSCAASGHLVVPRDVVAHERDRVALVRVGDHERRLARPERYGGQHVEQLAVVVTVHLHHREPERRRLLRPADPGRWSPGWSRPAAAGCGPRSRSAESSSYCEAAIIASQLLPSCSSPSPMSTYVRRHDTSSLADDGVPDRDRQAVSERAGVGLDRRAPWSGSGDRSARTAACRNVASSLTGEEAERRQRGVERSGDVPLAQDEPVALGVVDRLRA